MKAWKFWKLLLASVLVFGCWQFKTAPCQEAKQESVSKQVPSEGRVAGKIIDSLGKPVSNAIVVIQVITTGVGLSYADSRTDRDGNFALDYTVLLDSNVDASGVFLWVSSPRHELRCVRPAILALDKRLSLEIQLRTARPISVQITGGDGRTSVEPYLVSVPNGVFDSDRDTGLRTVVPDLIRSNLSRKLDANGNAELEGVHLDLKDRLGIINGDGFEFVVSQGVNQGFNFHIPKTGTLRGRIKNFESSQVQHVLVSSSQANWETSRKCQVDKNGEFIAYGLVPGQVSIDLKWNPKSVWQPEPFQRPKIAVNQTKDFEISLIQGTPVYGYVRTEDTREPIRNAKLTASCSFDLQTTGVEHYLVTNEDGHFFAYLAPGEWSLQVQDIGKWNESYDYPSNEKFTVQYEEKKVDLGEIELSALPTESGEVVDELGKPVADRWIAFITPKFGHATRFTQTDSSGKFKTRVFSVQRPDDVPFWVIYPLGEKSGNADPRTLPKLKVVESDPWLLRYESKQ